MNDRLQTMFDLQREFQGQVGYDFDQMPQEDRVAYIKEMYIALVDELHEALAETRWKPWASGEKEIVARKQYLSELVDVFHFFMNLFMVGGGDADELYQMYANKQQVNRDRQATGYDATSMKCANRECRRALDEPGSVPVTLRPGHLDLAWCDDGCYNVWYEKKLGDEQHKARSAESGRVEISPNVTLIISEDSA